MELKIIWDVFWRRKWIIIQVFLIISLTVIISSFFLTPVYESTVRLLLKKSTTESSVLTNIGIQDNKSMAEKSDYEMENNVEIATSKPILDTVILNLQISDAKGELMEPDKILNPGLLNMLNPEPTIEVNAVEESDLFEITATSANPEEAAMIANTLAQECIKENSAQKIEEYKYIKEFITNQINTVKDKYITALNQIKLFSSEHKTLDIEYEIQNTIDRLSDLMKEKEATIIELSETRAKITEFQKQLDKQSEQIVLGSTSIGNTYIEQLRNNIISYEMQLEEVLVEKKKDHPDARILEQKLKKSRSELDREIFLSKHYSSDLLTLKRDLAALEEHLSGLNTEIDTHRISFSSIPDKVFKNSQLKIDVEINQDLYKSMLEYLYQIRIAELSIFPDIRIIEEASVSKIEKPASPNKILNSLLGIFLGVICGFGLGFLIDYLDDTIKTREDVKKTGAILLGAVPKLKKNGRALISDKSPKDPICEAYRSIRNSIRFSSLDQPIKSLLVTSPIANEGKSTTACNLAISMTLEGKKVLLLDGDFRLPTVHKFFDLQNHIGSTNILLNQVTDASEAIQESGITNLSILSSGPIPPDPAKLIESKKMKELITDLSCRFDMVIIDSPPMLVANDAVILAGIADAVIIIMESNRETYSIFNQAKEIFTLANIKPMGVILNKFHMDRSQKYNYYYKA